MATAILSPTAAIDSLNSLLRSELSACETYRAAIKKIERHEDHDAIALRVMLANHMRHADSLNREIRNLGGGDPTDSAGAWGVYAKTVENVATLFGDSAATKALKEGEEHSLHLATQALVDLDGPARTLITETILPNTARHLDLIEALGKPL